MEMNGQPLALLLSPGKEPPVTIGQEDWSTVELIWMLWRKDKSPAPPGN